MLFLKSNWAKILSVFILIYVIAGGFLFEVPMLPVVHESIRNIYFHVGMWFSMMFVLALALYHSLAYLRGMRPEDDLKAHVAVKTSLVFGTLGLIIGMIWARATWGAFWVNDPKLNGAAVGMLIYLAYLVLRGSVENPLMRSKVAAVYNIFAFVLYFVFVMILPRMAVASIHPGIDGNPALATGDLDPRMQKVFFPAIAGWFLFAWWIFRVYFKVQNFALKIDRYS